MLRKRVLRPLRNLRVLHGPSRLKVFRQGELLRRHLHDDQRLRRVPQQPGARALQRVSLPAHQGPVQRDPDGGARQPEQERVGLVQRNGRRVSRRVRGNEGWKQRHLRHGDQALRPQQRSGGRQRG